YEGTLASVAAHDGRARQVGLEAVEHSGGTVETNHAMAGVHERLGNRHAVAAADVQNPRVGWERSGDRECFRDTHGPAAIRRIPIGNQIVLTHALRVRLYTSRSHHRAVKAPRSVAKGRVIRGLACTVEYY